MNPSLYIDNQWCAGNGATLTSLNPADNGTVWEGGEATADDVTCAIAAAKAAFGQWRITPLAKRLEYLEAFSAYIQENSEQLAKLICDEMGKPFWEAKTEVAAFAAKLGASKAAFEERCGESHGELGEVKLATRFQPLGVCVILGPFNFPAHLPGGHMLPALLAGNTVIFKPSEQTPAVGAWIAKAWQRVGLPAGVFNLVQGRAETGSALIESRDIAAVFFTGSYHVGSKIHRQLAGRPEVLLALEMGGNNPLVVDEIDDVDAAVFHTIQSAFITSGQRCVCARRLIVVTSNKSEAFIQRLIEVTGKLKVGYFSDEQQPFMGPIVNRESGSRFLGEQEKAIAAGAKPLLKMAALRDNPALLSPGILEISSEADEVDDEWFCPLLKLYRVDNFEAAVELTNRTAYGLAAGLISLNEEHYQLFRRDCRAGVINWNRQTTGASGRAPFGGSGLSGNHRPSAYFAADYCSYPVASMEIADIVSPQQLPEGMTL